jgi:hypothetical protein
VEEAAAELMLLLVVAQVVAGQVLLVTVKMVATEQLTLGLVAAVLVTGLLV